MPILLPQLDFKFLKTQDSWSEHVMRAVAVREEREALGLGWASKGLHLAGMQVLTVIMMEETVFCS